MSRIITTVFLFLAIAAVVLCGAPRAGAQNTHHSEQVVFSGGGFSEDLGSPYGFWIWCEADSTNPYQGLCNGAMYVYARGLTKHVSGTMTEFPEHSSSYHMAVASQDRSIIAVLTNTPPVKQGPHNTVTVDFSAPSVGSGVSDKNVVNVTGPQ
jgi:hypothetical protein